MSLRDWRNNRWVEEHQTTAGEITDLFDAMERDLVDCRASGLSPDWRLAIAYNAALRAATAALAASGYRPGREQQHYRVIQSLALTMKADPDLIAELDLYRKKRNITSYERMGTISNSEADQMIALAERLVARTREWMAAAHPELLRE